MLDQVQQAHPMHQYDASLLQAYYPGQFYSHTYWQALSFCSVWLCLKVNGIGVGTFLPPQLLSAVPAFCGSVVLASCACTPVGKFRVFFFCIYFCIRLAHHRLKIGRFHGGTFYLSCPAWCQPAVNLLPCLVPLIYLFTGIFYSVLPCIQGWRNS